MLLAPLVAPFVVFGLALALFLPRLTAPPVYVFDELYYAYTAGRYVAGDPGAYHTAVPPRDDPAIEWTHPPLGKLVIAGGILVAGDRPLGWRLPSVLLGAAGAAITVLLARRLTGDAAIAALAGGLLLLDGLYFVESRLGMSNILYVVLLNGSLLAFAAFLFRPPERAGPPLLAAGALLGLALATKWSAVALLGLVGLVVLWRIVALWRADATAAAGGNRGQAAALLKVAAVALVLLPAAIYLASYLHFFLTGHGWADFVALHRDMLAYHRDLGVVHPDSSSWWEWPLAASPIRYFIGERGPERAFIYANGNPLLYWPMAVAAAWVAIEWWGRRTAAAVVLVVGFFGLWLPWALSPRGTFIYHFLPAVPLGCVALAVVAVEGWRRGGWRRLAAAAWVLAAVAAFAFWYPLQAAVPLSPEQFDARTWFGAWR